MTPTYLIFRSPPFSIFIRTFFFILEQVWLQPRKSVKIILGPIYGPICRKLALRAASPAFMTLFGEKNKNFCRKLSRTDGKLFSSDEGIMSVCSLLLYGFFVCPSFWTCTYVGGRCSRRYRFRPGKQSLSLPPIPLVQLAELGRRTRSNWTNIVSQRHQQEKWKTN